MSEKVDNTQPIVRSSGKKRLVLLALLLLGAALFFVAGKYYIGLKECAEHGCALSPDEPPIRLPSGQTFGVINPLRVG